MLTVEFGALDSIFRDNIITSYCVKVTWTQREIATFYVR